MQRDSNIIDVSAIELDPTVRPKRRSRLLLLPLMLIPTVFMSGAAFDLWSGEVAMLGLMAVALLSVVIGINLKGRRLSSIYAVTIVAGVSGMALSIANFNGWLSFAGLMVGGLSLLVLSKIENRGWNYEN